MGNFCSLSFTAQAASLLLISSYYLLPPALNLNDQTTVCFTLIPPLSFLNDCLRPLHFHFLMTQHYFFTYLCHLFPCQAVLKTIYLQSGFLSCLTSIIAANLLQLGLVPLIGALLAFWWCLWESYHADSSPQSSNLVSLPSLLAHSTQSFETCPRFLRRFRSLMLWFLRLGFGQLS